MFFTCVCMCTQSCLTPCNPMDYSPPGSSVHGIFQAGIWDWVTISYSRGSSQLRDGTSSFYVSCFGRQILYQWRKLVFTLFHYPFGSPIQTAHVNFSPDHFYSFTYIYLMRQKFGLFNLLDNA